MLPNTLRRILEYYFKILGKYDLNELHKKFLGQHQIACRTLISWIHDGSHNADALSTSRLDHFPFRMGILPLIARRLPAVAIHL